MTGKKLPTLTADDIVSVQPMTEKSKVLDFKYGPREMMTDEEKSAMERFSKAVQAVNEFFRHSGSRYRDDTYHIPCPNCDGTLNFGGNSYNGHVRAFCTTDGCCSWIE